MMTETERSRAGPHAGVDWSELGRTPDGLRRQLAVLIERRLPYLVVSGTDPGSAGGCCPTAEAGAAARLVAAGVLSAWRPEPPGG